MEEWIKISILICTFGFIREIRPSEPFGIEFLTSEWKNITLDEVYREALPITTYSYLIHLIIIFLITDYLRYKPLIILSGICGIIVWSMLIWTKTLFEIQIIEAFLGPYLATEVAYYTYIYTKVDKKYFPKVTSHTRSALFIGKMIASISSQTLLFFESINYLELNYITLSTQIAATCWALFLPSVNSTIYFHRKKPFLSTTESTEILASSTKEPSAFKLIWLHFKNSYTNRYVLEWSIWYSVLLCGFLQIVSYNQTLWKAINKNPKIVWNGAVEGISTFFSAISTLSAGYIHAGSLTHRSSIVLISIISLFQGLSLLINFFSRNLYLSYGGYIMFTTLNAFSITVASAEIAKLLEEESFGLIFGVNTFVALVMQTILTVIVVDDGLIVLNIYEQHAVYSGYFVIFGFIFLIFSIIDLVLQKRRKKVDIPY